MHIQRTGEITKCGQGLEERIKSEYNGGSLAALDGSLSRKVQGTGVRVGTDFPYFVNVGFGNTRWIPSWECGAHGVG